MAGEMSPRGAAIAAWFVLAIGLVTPIGPLSAESGKPASQSVQAAQSKTGGRIVITWSKPVSAHAATVGNRVVLIFDRPLTASVSGVAASMPKVVRRIDASEDRRALTIVLKKPHRMQLIRRGRLVVVDLKQRAVAKAMPKPLAKPKMAAKPPAKSMVKATTKPAAKPPAKPQAKPTTVGVRYEWKPTLQRLTFAWDTPVKYSVERVGGVVWLKFRRPGRIDMEALGRALRGADIAVQTKPGTKMLEVFVRVPRTRPIRYRRAGSAVVLDVFGRTPAPPEMVKAPAKGAKTAKTAMKAPAKPVPPKPSNKTETKPEMKTAMEPAPADPPVDMLYGMTGPQVSLSMADGQTELRFDWPQPVTAAAFRRGRYLWLVFDAPANFDLSEIRRQLESRVFTIQQVTAPKVTALRIGAPSRIGIALTKHGASWRASLTNRPTKPSKAIAVEAQPEAAGGGRVLLKVANTKRPLEIRDPAVGDTIAVVPIATPGLGVASPRRYAKFRLLATVQGMAIVDRADGVAVRADPAAVTVSGYGGLNLSGLRVRKRNATKSTERVFDFERWRGGPPEAFPRDYIAAKQQRLHAVALADKAERNARRMELAQFYFAHGHAPETLAVLRRIELSDAIRARTPAFRALRGASHLLMGKIKAAGRDLYDPSLDRSLEVALWRGAAAAGAGKWRAANREFLRSGPIINRYPAWLRGRLAETAAKAALATGDLQRAKGLIALVRSFGPSPRDVERLDYLDAVVANKLGQHGAAVATWTHLSKNAKSREVRVRSLVARIERQLEFGTLDAAAAIDELETARYVWRGDDAEYMVSELLGRVYIKAGKPVEGLDALERAGRIDPKLAKARGLKARMRKEFVRLFVARGKKRMKPLRALAVFHEFSHLMPAGPDGDKMITALADRLVAVDLLGRASSLLEQQIKKRLSGTERAKVGARLALLRLLDKRPAAAVEALRVSDVDNMPAELAKQRRRLRARALASMGQTGNALVLLGPDQSREAELLRADIHWKKNAWKEAAAAYGRIANRIPKNATALDDAQSRTVLAWAVTLALAGDGAGLKSLRARFGKAMASGPYRATFQVIANEIEAGVPDFRKIASKVNEVEAYQAFMGVYRKRIAAGGLEAVN
jgi:hypothetical protein